MDGLIESITAARKDECLVNNGITDLNNKVMNYFTKERLTKYIKELQGTGFDFHIHAIGDRGVKSALDAIEDAQTDTMTRHRLAHVEVIDAADMPRFSQLNIPADIQVDRLRVLIVGQL